MRLKKVMGMSMALIMGVSTVAGCGSKSVTMPEKPADIAKLATERTNALKSYELNGTGKFDLEMMGEKVDMDMNIHAVYFKDPMKMKMEYEVSNAAEDAERAEKMKGSMLGFLGGNAIISSFTSAINEKLDEYND